MQTSPLSTILEDLKRRGLGVELVEDGALVRLGETRLALFAEAEHQGGVLVRAHLDLDLYVEEDGLTEILMGINLMNQGFDYGMLSLDPVELEDEDGEAIEDGPLTFAVLGRSVLWLTGLNADELARLHEHLRRFAEEVTGTVERTLHGSGGITA